MELSLLIDPSPYVPADAFGSTVVEIKMLRELSATRRKLSSVGIKQRSRFEPHLIPRIE
jgi:hypothetical protein